MNSGIILVDHGSQLPQSNALLDEVAKALTRRFPDRFPIVEPAHMDIAEPSIAAAYDRCVGRGATHLIICPYFLGPGKHWTKDIPRLAAAAQAHHPATTYHLTSTLGLDDLILELLAKRIGECQAATLDCPQCRATAQRG